jgi:hypothetical protein
MPGKNHRFVSPRPDGTWANQRVGSGRATSLHETQREAERAARENIRGSGGGELNIQGVGGQIRQKDTVPPATDPFPPRG